MPTFPHTINTGVYVYHLSSTKRSSLPPAEKARLRDLLHDRLLASRAPKDLDHPNGSTGDDVWGWYYPDAEANDLGHVGHLLVWGRRTWTKRADPGLLKASVDDRRAELQAAMEQEIGEYKALERTPPYKEMRAELNEKLKTYKEAIEQALRNRAQPKVREDGILLDDEHKRLVIFAASESQRDSLVFGVRRILASLYRADDLVISPWSLTDYLGRSRATSALPAQLGARFLTWLVEHAGTTWLEEQADGQTVEANDVLRLEIGGSAWHLQIEIGESAIAEHDGGRHTAKGSVAVGELLEQLEGGGFDLVRLELVIGEPGNNAPQRWAIVLDDEARLLKVKLLDSADKSPAYDDGGLYLRGEAFLRAFDAVVAIVVAWDLDDLQQLLEEDPQVGLFPLAPQTVGRWISEKGVPVASGEGENDMFSRGA